MTTRTLPQLFRTNPTIFALAGLLFASLAMIAVNFFLYQNVAYQRQVSQDIELKIPQKISVIPLVPKQQLSPFNTPLSPEELQVQAQQVNDELRAKEAFDVQNENRGALQNLPITTADYTVFLALDSNRITVFFFQSELSLEELKVKYLPEITEKLQQGGADTSQETLDFVKLEVPAPKES
jgi:uncharacterized protein YfaS (alpha-2-macroglobulin family)